MESLKKSSGMCQPVAREKIKPMNVRKAMVKAIMTRKRLRKILEPSPLKTVVNWSSKRARERMLVIARMTDDTRPTWAAARSDGVNGMTKGDAKRERYSPA